MKTYIRYIVTAISITLSIVTIVSTLFIILVTTLATLTDIVEVALEDTLEEPVVTTPVVTVPPVVTEPVEPETPVTESIVTGLAWNELQRLAKVLGVPGRKKADILVGLALVAPGTVSKAMYDTLGLF